MVGVAADAAADLADAGIGCRVVNVRSLKPLDTARIRALAAEAGTVVTVENHSVLGGLGSAVGEALDGDAVRLVRIGTPDRFGSSASADELRESFGLDRAGLTRRIKDAVA